MNEQIISAIWPQHAQEKTNIGQGQARNIAKEFKSYMIEQAAQQPREMILVQKDNHAAALRQANEVIEEKGTNSFLLLQEEQSGQVVEARAHMGEVANALYRNWA
jgi:hypothetical protein